MRTLKFSHFSKCIWIYLGLANTDANLAGLGEAQDSAFFRAQVMLNAIAPQIALPVLHYKPEAFQQI